MSDFQTNKKLNLLPLPYIGMYDLDLIYQTSDVELLYQILSKVNEIAQSQNIIIDNFEKVLDWAQNQIETYTKEQLQEWLDDGTLRKLINEILNKKDVYIPSDFLTIQEAIDYYYPIFKNTDTIINIIIESQHKITKGFVIGNGDYSRFTISSQDEIVYLAENFTNDYENVPTYIEEDIGESENALFIMFNGFSPTFDILVDADNKYGTGLYMFNCKFLVTPNHGVINSGNRGIEIRQSQGVIRNTKWDGANDCGVRLQNGSTCMGAGISANNCCKNTTLEHSAIYVSKGSVANIREGSATNSGKYGLIVRRSRADCEGMNFSNAALKGVLIEGASQVSLNGAIVDNCGTNGIDAGYGSIVRGPSSCKNNHNSDIYIRNGAIIDCTTTQTTNGRPGIVDLNQLPNLITNKGIIFGGNPQYEYITVDNFNMMIFNNGYFIGIYNQNINFDTPLKANESINISLPAIPEGYNVNYRDCNITLRENSGFSGRYLFSNLSKALINNICRVENTGVSTTTGLSIPASSYNVMYIIIGRNRL